MIHFCIIHKNRNIELLKLTIDSIFKQTEKGYYIHIFTSYNIKDIEHYKSDRIQQYINIDYTNIYKYISNGYVTIIEEGFVFINSYIDIINKYIISYDIICYNIVDYNAKLNDRIEPKNIPLKCCCIRASILPDINLNDNINAKYNNITYIILKDILISYLCNINNIKRFITKFLSNNMNTQVCKKYIDINNNICKKTVYIISNIRGGGASKYINDLISTYEANKMIFSYISSVKELNVMSTNIRNNDIILMQHLINTDISIQLLLNIIKDVKNRLNIQLITTIHDFYFFNDSYDNLYRYSNYTHSSYLEDVKPLKECSDLLYLSDIAIMPSVFVKNEFDKYFDLSHNSIVCEHIDTNVNHDYINIPYITNNIINIAIPHQLSEYKGIEYYNILFSISKYKGYNIKYHLFTRDTVKHPNIICHQPYNEDNLNDILQKNNIHAITFFNKWGETYCYSLTKGINSGLPIIYTNIGAFTERLPENKKYFPINSVPTKPLIQSMLYKCIDFILTNNIKTGYMDIYKTVPKLYDNIFKTNYMESIDNLYDSFKDKYEIVHKTVQPYAIYFPQFHAIHENNIAFYNGFHDNKNLDMAIKTNPNLYTPLNSLLGNYNLKYDNIINTQVSLAKSYGIKGFGIYYYWFSHNTVSGNNMLMKDVIDKFFEDKYDNFDVFFVYANEDWSNNPAFNQKENNHTIKNLYTEDNICNNINMLIPYFKHSNYRKIDNKPVFLLHHPWLLHPTELFLFKQISEKICIDNGFSGIHIILNGMVGKIRGFTHYHHHSNYKTMLSNSFIKIENNRRYIDYKAYINNYLPTEDKEDNLHDIHTIFTNFDNSVRLYNHANKDILITRTLNNSLDEFNRFLNIQLNKYTKKDKVNEVSKIFLMNAWNEWGEQMVLEPSNELGFSYLEILRNNLLKI